MNHNDLKVGDWVSTTLQKWIDNGFTNPRKVTRIYTFGNGYPTIKHEAAILVDEDGKQHDCNIEYLIIDKPAIRAKNLELLLGDDQDILQAIGIKTIRGGTGFE